MNPKGAARTTEPDPRTEVIGEDDPFRPVLLWFRERFLAFEVSGRRGLEEIGRYRGGPVTVYIDIERPETKGLEQVHQIVVLRISSPPLQPVVERLAEIVQANSRGLVEIETWKGNSSRWPTEIFPEDAYLVTDYTTETNLATSSRAVVLSSDGRVLRKLLSIGRDEPLQWDEDYKMKGTEMSADNSDASEASRLAHLLAEESEQLLARIPSDALQRFLQGARQVVDQVDRHRYEEGERVLVRVDKPLIGGQFVFLHEDGEAEIRVKVPMTDVRPEVGKGEPRQD